MHALSGRVTTHDVAWWTSRFLGLLGTPARRSGGKGHGREAGGNTDDCALALTARRRVGYLVLRGHTVRFEYACFVSYRHPHGRLMARFTDQLLAALRDYIAPYLDLPLFFDRTGLEGGQIYEAEFAHALSHSVCMVAVYTPTYFDYDRRYCAREYRAMEVIEEQRFAEIENEALKRRGLIIPIILKGRPPAYVSDKRNCKYDFSRFTLCSQDISRHPEYAGWFDEIGNSIRQIHDWFRGDARFVSAALQEVAIPENDEVELFLHQVVPWRQPPFPGRWPSPLATDQTA